MKITRLGIDGLLLVEPARFGDERGFFSETFSTSRLAEAGVREPFVQDNHSLSRVAGTLRGLHCQVGASAQGKLVRCVRGRLWDVAVDARAASPTYGQYEGIELSAENWLQLWIPAGFLHGFCTLEPDTEVIYKVTAPYDREAERGVRWDDPTLSLPWPVGERTPVLSAKDAALPEWEAARTFFPA